MNNFIRSISLLTCGCFAAVMACDNGGNSGTATGGAGGEATASGTGGANNGGSAQGGAAGGPAEGIAQLCPELVAANCAALATYLTSEAVCTTGLPMMTGTCPDAADALYACTGADPEITCNACQHIGIDGWQSLAFAQQVDHAANGVTARLMQVRADTERYIG